MAKTKSEDVKLTTAAQVVKLLRDRYPSPAWAFFENVGDGTGMNQRRWADALAMSLWPSRGLVFYGFEVKVSRQDVLRELAVPQKADAVAKYCDYWWLVAGSASIVSVEEVPPSWGLMVPTTVRGNTTLRVAKEATKLEAKEIDRKFTAAVLRRAAEHFDVQKIRQDVHAEIYDEVHAKLDAQYGPQHEQEVQHLKTRLDTVQGELDSANERLSSVLGMAYHSSVINRAIDFLRWLDGWSCGLKAVEHVHSGMLTQIDRLQDVHTQLTDLRTLMQTMHERKNEETAPAEPDHPPGFRPPGHHLGDTRMK